MSSISRKQSTNPTVSFADRSRRAEERDATSAETSLDAVLTTPGAAELLKTKQSDQRRTRSGLKASPTTSERPSTTATSGEHTFTGDTSTSTPPFTSFYSSYRTFQRTGDQAPSGTFTETVGRNGQTATRSGKLNEKGEWDTQIETDPHTAEWDDLMRDLRTQWVDMWPATLGTHRRGLMDIERSIFDPFYHPSLSAMPRGVSMGTTAIWDDPFFPCRSWGPRSMGPPSTVFPPLLSTLPWVIAGVAAGRAMDQDTASSSSTETAPKTTASRPTGKQKWAMGGI